MGTAERILIFANPMAGRGKGLDIARRLELRFQKDGYDARVLLKRPDLLRPDDLPPDARAAVVIGGDGTLRAVADRLCAACGTGDSDVPFQMTDPTDGRTATSAYPQPQRQSHVRAGGLHSGRLSSPDPEPQPPAPSPSLDPKPKTPNPSHSAGPPLLVVPLGTANLMGRHLGIKWVDATLEDQVAAAVRERRVVQLDAGRAHGRLFLLMAGVGFDAAVVHELHRVRRGPIGYINYVLPAALALKDYRYPALRVTIDGREVWPPGPAVAYVGNVPEYGTGFPILSRARPDDGLLDVCVMPCRTPVDLAKFLLLSTTGDHLLADGVLYATGRHVTVEAPAAARPVPVQIDGDAAGHTPVSLDLLPLTLGFIVP